MEETGLGSPGDRQSKFPEQRNTAEESLVNSDPIEHRSENDADYALEEATPEFSAVAGFLSIHLQNRPTAEDLKEKNILLPSEEYLSFARDLTIKEDTKDLLSQDEQDQLKDHLEKVLAGEITMVQEGIDKQNQNAEGQEITFLSDTHESSPATSQSRPPDRRRDSIRRTLSSKDASALAHRLSKRILKEQISGVLNQLKAVDEHPQDDPLSHAADEIPKIKLPEPDPVVKTCIAFLLDKGLEIPGLFRVPASSNEVLALRNRMAKDPTCIPSDCDPNAVAGVLKQHFRDMPEPVFSFEIYDCIMAAETIPELPARINCYVYLTKTLKSSRLSQLVSLMHFLYEVHKKSEINLMTSRNLATIFAPNILRPSFQTIQQMSEDVKRLPFVVDEFIINSHEIFQAYLVDIRSFGRTLRISAPLTEEELTAQPPPPTETRQRNISGTLGNMFSFSTPTFLNLTFPGPFSGPQKKDTKPKRMSGAGSHAVETTQKPHSPFGLSTFLGKMGFKKGDEAHGSSINGEDERPMDVLSSASSDLQDAPPVPPRAKGKN